MITVTFSSWKYWLQFLSPLFFLFEKVRKGCFEKVLLDGSCWNVQILLRGTVDDYRFRCAGCMFDRLGPQH